ncbi:GNAT family N-acetyltransferase [Agromyces mangrovi Wang et al. 2018]|uniref:GNAT family N-acetyltransferase n=1 Tax=Agromyces mangrovi TaxID=1858653 RepID=UPI0025738DA1|nr:GNAT family N-acetyltransferase [Agromyces mangrovi]BDZ64838.1 N-acetyltransferase [Agromyces mangrovi]
MTETATGLAPAASHGDPTVREATAAELIELGRVLVAAYSSLDGFASPEESPDYYRTLANVGAFAERPGVAVLVAVDAAGAVLGGVVSFGDMDEYGVRAEWPGLDRAGGIRLLGVSPDAQGRGIGRMLIEACVLRARAAGLDQIVLHSTEPMRVARAMYERLGFAASPELDFTPGTLHVYGYRLAL